MKVIVIGCGPAGLAAAHAAVGLGAEVRVIAPKKMTPQNGPVTIQNPIPGISVDHPDGYIRQLVVGGSILDYRLKLYGDVNVNINGNIMRPGYDAWQVRAAYYKMWDLYSWMVEDGMVAPGDIQWLVRDSDLVVCSAPAKSLCYQDCDKLLARDQECHEFRSVPIALKFSTSYPNQPENTVIYNARKDEPWVRSSLIFGVGVTDYKVEDCPNPDLIIQKPLGTDCDCHPKVLRVGRYGKWHNLSWIDSAYSETRESLLSMMHQQEWSSVV